MNRVRMWRLLDGVRHVIDVRETQVGRNEARGWQLDTTPPAKRAPKRAPKRRAAELDDDTAAVGEPVTTTTTTTEG